MTNHGLPDPKQTGLAYALAQISTEMVAPIVLGVIVDVKLDWKPWGTLVGVVIGLVGGFAHLVALLNRPKGSGPREET
jgi:F0F1-type ATP synthase assembly protein I